MLLILCVDTSTLYSMPSTSFSRVVLKDLVFTLSTSEQYLLFFYTLHSKLLQETLKLLNHVSIDKPCCCVYWVAVSTGYGPRIATGYCISMVAYSGGLIYSYLMCPIMVHELLLNTAPYS